MRARGSTAFEHIKGNKDVAELRSQTFAPPYKESDQSSIKIGNQGRDLLGILRRCRRFRRRLSWLGSSLA
jgi:hypothetical protein